MLAKRCTLAPTFRQHPHTNSAGMFARTLPRTKPDFRRSLGAFHPQRILRSTCPRNNAGAAPRTAARIICALWRPQHRPLQAQHLRVGADGCRKPRGSSSVRTRRKSNAIACGEDTRTPFAFSCSAVFDSRAGRGRGPFGIESLCLKGAGALPRPGLVMSAREAQPQADTDSTAMRHRLPCGTGLAVNKKTVQILTDKCKVRGML